MNIMSQMTKMLRQGLKQLSVFFYTGEQKPSIKGHSSYFLYNVVSIKTKKR